MKEFNLTILVYGLKFKLTHNLFCVILKRFYPLNLRSHSTIIETNNTVIILIGFN